MLSPGQDAPLYRVTFEEIGWTPIRLRLRLRVKLYDFDVYGFDLRQWRKDMSAKAVP